MNPLADKTAWRQWYKARNEALERVRARQLAAMTDQEALKVSLSLCAIRTWRQRSDWSGLIEQQAYFHRRNRP